MVIQISKNIYIGGTIAGKSKNEKFEESELQSPHRPRFGRNWWFWVPTARTNGGRLKSYENTDINFHWLCFTAWVTIFSWNCEMS